MAATVLYYILIYNINIIYLCVKYETVVTATVLYYILHSNTWIWVVNFNFTFILSEIFFTLLEPGKRQLAKQGRMFPKPLKLKSYKKNNACTYPHTCISNRNFVKTLIKMKLMNIHDPTNR